MRQIGITGGIGAGKSLVCRVFAALGIPVYVADERAKWLTENDPILKTDIVRLLGRQAYDPAGHYNRAFVAAEVFDNPARLAALNALVHPRVAADNARWTAQQRAPYVVKEAALMRAAGDQNTLDVVVVVTAPLPLRISRIRARDPHRNDTEIQAIIDRQLSDADREKLADHVLVNDELVLLLPQIIRLDRQFRQLA